MRYESQIWLKTILLWCRRNETHRFFFFELPNELKNLRDLKNANVNGFIKKSGFDKNHNILWEINNNLFKKYTI